ncbi:endo alpha-1,4 polygalactosaminidase [Vibrio quintilis]|uniref:Glycoside-hydrolase family GH114 TIM-barrel domain-containing protein n=1 Tax=Vibrio quintilis TaxID=1117707 RepID=A0A1M7YWE1_9VIBR|nr:endo alpha-1,4 polygalactosaminidase [Vibrio quintilis]SHO56908.1 hypothetical protein VQ7734_02677 [Vibrio quintilis]
MAQFSRLICFILIVFSFTASAQVSSHSIAFYYNSHLPLAEMSLYSRVVVQPDQVNKDARNWLHQRKIKLYAYLSVGESRQTGHQGLMTNTHWNSQVMDLTSASWQSAVLEQAKQLKAQGYDGLFLDTLDSYQMLKPQQQGPQRRALVALIKQLSALFSHQLILNRGFDLLPQLQGQAKFLVAEGLYTHYRPKHDTYSVTKESDQQWLINQLQQAQKLGFQVQVIDYAKPEERFAVAKKIIAAGFLPWVTDGHLQTWGTSELQPVPRKILIPYNSKRQYLTHSDVHNRLAAFIEYLGYIPAYLDMSRQSLPTIDPALYAGVISWTLETRMYSPAYVDWLLKAKGTLPLMVLGQLPQSDKLLKVFGVKMLSVTPPGPYKIRMMKPWLKGEYNALRPDAGVFPLQLIKQQDAEPLITITSADGRRLIQGVRSGRDVLIAAPWLIENLSVDDSRWMIEPYQLLSRAFQLPPIPAPDVTTESGRRRLISYIDGDAFSSLARLPGQPIAAKVIKDEILKPYKIPVTVSIVEGEVGPKGMYPEQSPYYEKIARQIFALPYVDMATHTFSHPFFWNELAGRQKVLKNAYRPYGSHLAVPDYDKIDIRREIEGSIDYINQRLAPKGKKVTAVLWSGDALPGPDPIRHTLEAGVVNVNGGDSFVTDDNPTLSEIAPLGRPEGELLYQIYAPLMNEELYTNVWHGPFDGFKRLTETFRHTDKPYRLKPFTIYYHFYSGTNPAGIRALKIVLDYALSRPNTPVQLARYARGALDFYFSGLARNDKGEWVFSSRSIPTLRIPESLGRVDLQHSRHVAGMTEDERYIHLPQGQAVFKTFVKSKPVITKPYLVSGNVVIREWSEKRIVFHSWLKAQLILANADQCHLVSSDGRRHQGVKQGNYRRFSMPRGDFSGRLVCHR